MNVPPSIIPRPIKMNKLMFAITLNKLFGSYHLAMRLCLEYLLAKPCLESFYSQKDQIVSYWCFGEVSFGMIGLYDGILEVYGSFLQIYTLYEGKTVVVICSSSSLCSVYICEANNLWRYWSLGIEAGDISSIMMNTPVLRLCPVSLLYCWW
mgnify:CR=1 FL=1